MKGKKLALFLLFAVSQWVARSQDSSALFNDLPLTDKVTAAFKSPRVIMSHSIEMVKTGVLDFRILHRFGNVNEGIGELFGLDQATIRLGFDYGISNNLSIGIGRGNYKKEIDGFLKYRPIQQSTGSGATPVSLLLVGGTTVQTAPWAGAEKQESFVNRQSHYGQVIVGRKFSEAFSFQLSPTIVHHNLVPAADPNDTYAVGTGARLRLSRRVTLNADYVVVFNKAESFATYNPLSVGVDIETGGHVFQVHLTNAIGMNERAFLTETTNRWSKGDIQFGFNISRSFQAKKKKID